MTKELLSTVLSRFRPNDTGISIRQCISLNKEMQCPSHRKGIFPTDILRAGMWINLGDFMQCSNDNGQFRPKT